MRLKKMVVHTVVLDEEETEALYAAQPEDGVMAELSQRVVGLLRASKVRPDAAVVVEDSNGQLHHLDYVQMELFPSDALSFDDSFIPLEEEVER